MGAHLFASLLGLLNHLECFLKVLLGGSGLSFLEHLLDGNLDSSYGVSLHHVLDGSLHGLGRSEGVSNSAGSSNNSSSSNSSSDSVGSSLTEDMSDSSHDMSRASGKRSVGSHHVVIVSSNHAGLLQNMEHPVDHSMVVSGGVMDDGMELVNKSVMLDQPVHGRHVEGSFHMTF